METISVELLDFALWKCDVCLSERLQPDVRARIIRCKAQMEWFDFFSALHLGEHLYCLTDNLYKDLQGTKMAAVSGQRLANLTKGTLTKIRIDQSSWTISMLMLPGRVEACLANQRFQENDTLRTDWRLVLVYQAIPKLLKITLDGPYYEAIDLIVRAIYQRVNQESFSS